MANRNLTQDPPNPLDPPLGNTTAPAAERQRTTKVVEEESLATSAAGPHRPEPARQVFHDPGAPPIEPPRPRHPSANIMVRATQDGYYGEARRRTGDVFPLEKAEDFSFRWMEMVDGSTPPRTSTGKDVLKRQHDEVMGARLTGDRARSGRDTATGDTNVLDE